MSCEWLSLMKILFSYWLVQILFANLKYFETSKNLINNPSMLNMSTRITFDSRTTICEFLSMQTPRGDFNMPEPNRRMNSPFLLKILTSCAGLRSVIMMLPVSLWHTTYLFIIKFNPVFFHKNSEFFFIIFLIAKKQRTNTRQLLILLNYLINYISFIRKVDKLNKKVA